MLLIILWCAIVAFVIYGVVCINSGIKNNHDNEVLVGHMLLGFALVAACVLTTH